MWGQWKNKVWWPLKQLIPTLIAKHPFKQNQFFFFFFANPISLLQLQWNQQQSAALWKSMKAELQQDLCNVAATLYSFVNHHSSIIKMSLAAPNYYTLTSQYVQNGFRFAASKDDSHWQTFGQEHSRWQHWWFWMYERVWNQQPPIRIQTKENRDVCVCVRVWRGALF